MTAKLTIKNDRYYAVINYKNGDKYCKKWIALGLQVKNNKRKAEAKMAEVLEKFKEENSLVSSNTTLVDFVNNWIEEKKTSVSETTYYYYKRVCAKVIANYFGKLNLKLCDLRPKHVQDFLSYLVNKGYKTASIRLFRAVLHSAIKNALVRELITLDPFVGVSNPQNRKEEKTEKVFLNAEAANQLINAFAGHWLQPIIVVTLYYGLRCSEVLGLRWSAIDFQKNTLKINHMIVSRGKAHGKDTMKTESSYHTFQLIDDVKTLLSDLHNRYLKTLESNKLIYNDQGYVFCHEDGSPLSPSGVSGSFAFYLKKHNLQKMRFHDLRHSTASILYDKGWNIKDIQTWLRHSSIVVTSDIYTHISKERQSKMAEELKHTFNIGGETK